MSDIQAAPGLDITGPLTDTLRAVLLFLPKLAAFVAIVVVGWVASQLIKMAVRRALVRFGFDRVVQRSAVSRTLARTRYTASELIARLVYYAFALVTLQIAFGVFGPNPVSDLIKGVVGWLPKAAVAIVIVVVAGAIASAVRDIAGTALAGLSYGRLLAIAASWAVIGLGLIAALNQIGVATTVTMPVLIAALATAGGILVVGLGGGLVRPMQQRWETMLDRAARDGQSIAQHAGGYLAARLDLQQQMGMQPGMHAGMQSTGTGFGTETQPAHAAMGAGTGTMYASGAAGFPTTGGGFGDLAGAAGTAGRGGTAAGSADTDDLGDTAEWRQPPLGN